MKAKTATLFVSLLFTSYFVKAQGTCEIYWSQNNTERIFSLSRLSLPSAPNFQGGCLYAGSQISLHDYMTIPDTTIFNLFTIWAKKMYNNLDTNAVVLLDIENPVHIKRLGVDYGSNPQLQDSIIKFGFKRRIDIVRSILPNAIIGLYGVVVPIGTGKVDALQLQGLRRAKKLGMFDSLDMICPVFYARWQDSEQIGKNYFSKSMRTGIACAYDSLKTGKLIAPYLSLMVYNPSSGYNQKWLSAKRAQQYIDTLQKLQHVDKIIYWTANVYDDKKNPGQWKKFNDSLENYFTDSVHVLSVANFESTYVGNNRIKFTNTSINADWWRWYFGDGTIASAENPYHTFPHAGPYSVKLVVKYKGRCPEEITMNVIVGPGKNGVEGNFYNDSGFSIYPNPAQGQTTINFSNYQADDEYEIIVYNSLGETVKIISGIKTSEFLFDTEGIQAGIYFIRAVKQQEVTGLKKLIVQ